MKAASLGNLSEGEARSLTKLNWTIFSPTYVLFLSLLPIRTMWLLNLSLLKHFLSWDMCARKVSECFNSLFTVKIFKNVIIFFY